MASKPRNKKTEPVVMATVFGPSSSSFTPTGSRLLYFEPLSSDGSNFLEWVNDAKHYLAAEELDICLETNPAEEVSDVYKSQALVILRRHLDHSLHLQYIQVTDPARLWTQLKERFDHQQTLFLPQARSDWINLRVLDFPDFVTFNSELHRIVSTLRLCGETITENELIEKTLSTFPPATAILSQQYRNMRFTQHSQLMAHLLLAEKHQQLLLKNAESRPAREVHVTIPVTRELPVTAPEAHATEAPRRPPKGFTKRFASKPKRYVPRSTSQQPKHLSSKPSKGNCHKCGRKGHYAKECRASAYVIELYKEVQRLKNQSRENYNIDIQQDNTLDVENFMTVRGNLESETNQALLDSASTHTILTNPKFFNFSDNKSSW